MEARDKQTVVSLPDSLREQFATLERALWRKETTMAAAAVVTALLISLLLLFVSDRLWDTPRFLRLILTGGGLGLGIWLLQRWLILWYWRRRDLRAFARFVQKRHRRLGDRLLGVVELAGQKELPENMSPALCRAAIRQVTEEASKLDFTSTVDFNPARKLLIVAGSAVGVAVLLSLIAPSAVGNALKRWLMPVADAPRYTFVAWEGLPTEIVVPHGEEFSFQAQVNYRSFWKPDHVGAQLGAFETKAVVEKGIAHFDLPPQTEPAELKLRAGDAVAIVRVRPEHRPALRQLTARIALPEYLQQSPMEESAVSGKLRVLTGASVTLDGEISRPLKKAWLQLDRQPSIALNTRASSFHSEPLNLKGVQRAMLNWTDELGLTNRAPWQLAVETVTDAPPQVELADLMTDVAILEDEVLRINAISRDDFGVKDTSLLWQIMAGPSVTNSPGAQIIPRHAPNPATKQLKETFVFSPSVLNIPSDSTVELRAQATDFFPGRSPSESGRFRVHVIGHVKHAEMVRQQFEQMFAKLEEVTRKEESLSNAARDLKKLSDDKLSKDPAGEKAGEQAKQQDQNARQLQDIAREGKDTLREALRNPTFNEETLREWSKTLQSMQQLSKNQMQEASKALQQAQQAQGEQKVDERSEQLTKAQTAEEEALRSLEKMQQDVNQGLDKLQAQTLAQRLRQLSKEEKRIGEFLQTIVPETVGLMPSELPSRYLNTLNDLSGSQAKTKNEAKTVQDEMSRFFERTQRPQYGEVSKAMKDAETPEQLDKLRHLMLANVSLQSLQGLNDWSQHFDDWANKLEPKSDSKSGGGGGQQGGGQGGADNYIKLLMTFLRLRESEYNLVDRTRLLEQRKTVDPQYAANAKKLSESQFLSRRQVIDVQMENDIPDLDAPLEDTFQSMRKTETVLQTPKTDQVAEQSEVKVVENLSDMINLLNEKQKQKNQSQQQQQANAQEMAFLMEMVQQQQAAKMPGMKPGSAPGMNQNGGTTDHVRDAAQTDGQGNRDQSRATGNTTGTTQQLPVEFRDALESYFKAIEKLDE